jgi:hypothetical protein
MIKASIAQLAAATNVDFTDMSSLHLVGRSFVRMNVVQSPRRCEFNVAKKC